MCIRDSFDPISPGEIRTVEDSDTGMHRAYSADPAPGHYMLMGYADAISNMVPETDDNNNWKMYPVEVLAECSKAPTVSPTSEPTNAATPQPTDTPSASPTAGPKADLIVTDIEGPASICPDQEWTVKYTIKNVGTGATEMAEGYFHSDLYLVPFDPVPTMVAPVRGCYSGGGPGTNLGTFGGGDAGATACAAKVVELSLIHI